MQAPYLQVSRIESKRHATVPSPYRFICADIHTPLRIKRSLRKTSTSLLPPRRRTGVVAEELPRALSALHPIFPRQGKENKPQQWPQEKISG